MSVRFKNKYFLILLFLIGVFKTNFIHFWIWKIVKYFSKNQENFLSKILSANFNGQHF